MAGSTSRVAERDKAARGHKRRTAPGSAVHKRGAGPVERLRALQRQAGNRAVQRLLTEHGGKWDAVAEDLIGLPERGFARPLRPGRVGGDGRDARAPRDTRVQRAPDAPTAGANDDTVKAADDGREGTKVHLKDNFLWTKDSFVRYNAKATMVNFTSADLSGVSHPFRFAGDNGLAEPGAAPFTARPGDKGQIVTTIAMDWSLQNNSSVPVAAPLLKKIEGTSTGTASIQIMAPFKVTAKGQISWRQPRHIQEDSEGAAASLTIPVGVTKDPDSGEDDSGTFTVSPTLNIQGTTAVAFTPATIPVVGTSAQFQQQQNTNDTVTRAFPVDVNVGQGGGGGGGDNPPTPSQKASKFFEQEVHFRVNSDKVDDDAFLALRAWAEGQAPGVGSGADPIPPDGLAAVEGGQSTVNLFGQASNTGSPTHNQQLSEHRAQHVQQLLQDFWGSKAVFNLTAGGPVEDGSTQEEGSARRVLIDFTADVGSSPDPDIVKSAAQPQQVDDSAE